MELVFFLLYDAFLYFIPRIIDYHKRGGFRNSVVDLSSYLNIPEM